MIAPVVGYSLGQVATVVAQLIRVPITVRHAGVAGYADVLLLSVVTSIFVVISFGVADVARVELLSGRWRPGTVPELPNTRDILLRTLVAVCLAVASVGIVAQVLATRGVTSDWVSWHAVLATVVVCICGWLAIAAAPYLSMLDVDGRLVISNALKGVGSVTGLACVWAGFFLTDSPWASSAFWAIGSLMPFFIPMAFYGADVLWTVVRRTHGKGDAGVLALLPAVSFIATALDPFSVQFWLHSSDVAAYGIANRLAVGILFLPLSLRSFLWLRLGRAARERSLAARWREALAAAAAFAGLASPAAILLVIFGPSFAVELGGSEARGTAALYVAFGVSGVAAAACMAFQAVGAMTAGRKTSVRLAVVFAAGNVALSFVAAWLVGVSGPAIAGALSNVAMLGAWLWLLRSKPALLQAV